MGRWHFLLPLVAGLLTATGFAPLWNWPLALLALAGLHHLVASATSMRSAMMVGGWFGFGYFVLGLNWIAHAFTFQDAMPHWFGFGAVALLAIYLAVFPAIAAGLGWLLGRGSRAALVLSLAAGWIVSELLRASVFTGFAWNPLGVIALAIGIAPAATVIGTYGLSGLVVLLGGALWLLLDPAHRRSGYAMLAGFGLLWAVALLIPTQAVERGPAITVVQPNIGQETKHDPAFDGRNWLRLARLSEAAAATPRLMFWPEAAIPDFLEQDAFARRRVASLLGPGDLLLTGGDALIYDRKGDLIGGRNSVFIVNAKAQILGRYDKAHLVPYGEYLPMRPLLSAIGLSRLVPGDIDFWAGPGPKTLALGGFGRVGLQICYEIVFSGEVVDRTNRPDFIFNPSNDAWFGSWGPPQHLAQARLRALEEGLPVIRSTPTGISAVIDAHGNIVQSVGHQREGVIQATLPAPLPSTLFGRFGNALPVALALLLAISGVAIGRRSR